MIMGGHQVTNFGSGDGGPFDEDGYDEAQRAEILEATRDGPSDGTIITDLDPDVGLDDDEDDDEDDLQMLDGEVAEQDDDADQDEDDIDEDVVQDEFDDGTIDEDEDVDDEDDTALNP
jgi:DNA-directed RNA polymerase subunit delta